MKRIWIITIMMLVILAGCDKKEPEPSGTPEPVESTAPEVTNNNDSGFIYTYNGVDIVMGAEAKPIIDALGGQPRVFEAPSCAFDGIDRIYYYSDFELYTYPDNGTDYILSVNLMDDSVETREGIILGSPVDAMLEAYGSDYTLENGMYTYTVGGSQLAVMTSDGFVVQITYYNVTDK